MHTHKHTYVHMYMHTHTHTHMYTFTTDTCTQHAYDTHRTHTCMCRCTSTHTHPAYFLPINFTCDNIVERYCCLTCIIQILLSSIYVYSHNLSLYRALNNDFKYHEKKLLDLIVHFSWLCVQACLM